MLDPSINRNQFELKRIMRLKGDNPDMVIKLLGVFGCYGNCIYAWRHAELPVLHSLLKNTGPGRKNSLLGAKIDFDKCSYKVKDIADEIKRPIIRPEDISYYETNRLADCIKVAYRNDHSELLKRKLGTYFRRSLEGDLFSLFYSNRGRKISCDNKKIPPGFIKKVMNCNKDCGSCAYCANLAKKYLKQA